MIKRSLITKWIKEQIQWVEEREVDLEAIAEVVDSTDSMILEGGSKMKVLSQEVDTEEVVEAISEEEEISTSQTTITSIRTTIKGMILDHLPTITEMISGVIKTITRDKETIDHQMTIDNKTIDNRTIDKETIGKETIDRVTRDRVTIDNRILDKTIDLIIDLTIDKTIGLTIDLTIDKVETTMITEWENLTQEVVGAEVISIEVVVISVEVEVVISIEVEVVISVEAEVVILVEAGEMVEDLAEE